MTKRAAHPFAAIGFLAAVFALVSQLAFGAVLPANEPSPQQIAALNAVRILCDGVQPAGHGGKADHGHRPLAPAICPIGVALSVPVVIPTQVPVLPPPTSPALFIRALEHPPGRGPPPATARVGVPRAPPLSI